MQVKTFEINGIEIVDSGGRVDWNYVIETPKITITSNAHTHNDRYYVKSEVDLRITSLQKALNSLQEKVNKIK